MISSIEGKTYPFPDVEQLARTILSGAAEKSVQLVIGDPGSGKSVFLTQLYERLNDKLDCLVAIRAELLRDEDSPDAVLKQFSEVSDRPEIKLFILDSLDVLAQSRNKQLLSWLACLYQLRNIKGMHIICACRTFEANHLYPLNEQDWSKKISLEALPLDFVLEILGEMGPILQQQNAPLLEMLRTPLYLRLAADIMKKGGDLREIQSLHALYTMLGQTFQITNNDQSLLSELASLMVKERNTYIPYSLVGPQLMDFIREKGRGLAALLTIDEANGGVIGFTHQTFIDYFFAIKVTKEEMSLTQFIVEHGQSLFIRPTLKHILEIFRATSKFKLLPEIKKVFLGPLEKKEIGYRGDDLEIRMHIKNAILADMATWQKINIQESALLLEIFKESKEKASLIIQFFNNQPSVDWFYHLKESYLLPTIRTKNESDTEYRLILSYVASLAELIPSEVLDVSLLLLEKEKTWMTEWFFRIASDNLYKIRDFIKENKTISSKYESFLSESVRRDYIEWDYEVSIFCKKLAFFNSEEALDVSFGYLLKAANLKENNSREIPAHEFIGVLEEAYLAGMDRCMLKCVDYFNLLFAAAAEGEKQSLTSMLFDFPEDVLYSQRDHEIGFASLYRWFSDKARIYVKSTVPDKAKEFIQKLENNKWATQRHLSILCKVEVADKYSSDITNFLIETSATGWRDESFRGLHVLYLHVLDKGFSALKPEERKEYFYKISNLKSQLNETHEIFQWIWKPLHHINLDLLPENIKELLNQLKLKYKFKDYKYRPPIMSGGFVSPASPVPYEQLRFLKEEELYKILIEKRSLKSNWDDDLNFIGGGRDLAETVSKLFIENIEKYGKVVNRLAENSENDIYLKWFLIDFPTDKIQHHKDFIMNLIVKVHLRPELQLEIARLLYKTVGQWTIAEIKELKCVIEALSKAEDPANDRFYESRKQGYSNDALSDGINSTRGVSSELLSEAIRHFSSEREWLLNLLNQLSLDQTVTVRAVITRHLPYLIEPLSWNQCFQIFKNVFAKNPEEFANLIVLFLRYVPSDHLKDVMELLNKMQKSGIPSLEKAFGSLLAIYYLRELIDETQTISFYKEAPSESQNTFIHFLVNQLQYENVSPKSIAFLTRVLDDLEKIDIELLFLRTRPEDFSSLETIIETVIKKKSMRNRGLYYLLEYLEKCLLFDAKKSFRTLALLLDNADDDFYQGAHFIPASHSSAPLSIINTIFQCFPEMEHEAMKILDKLIDLRWTGVEDYFKSFERI